MCRLDLSSLGQGSANFSVKNPVVNILGFADYVISVTTKAVIENNKQMSMSVFNKTLLTRDGGSRL